MNPFFEFHREALDPQIRENVRKTLPMLDEMSHTCGAIALTVVVVLGHIALERGEHGVEIVCGHGHPRHRLTRRRAADRGEADGALILHLEIDQSCGSGHGRRQGHAHSSRAGSGVGQQRIPGQRQRAAAAAGQRGCGQG